MINHLSAAHEQLTKAHEALDKHTPNFVVVRTHLALALCDITRAVEKGADRLNLLDVHDALRLAEPDLRNQCRGNLYLALERIGLTLRTAASAA